MKTNIRRKIDLYTLSMWQSYIKLFSPHNTRLPVFVKKMGKKQDVHDSILQQQFLLLREKILLKHLEGFLLVKLFSFASFFLFCNFLSLILHIFLPALHANFVLTWCWPGNLCDFSCFHIPLSLGTMPIITMYNRRENIEIS